MLKFLKNILQLLLNPAQGWNDIEEENRKFSVISRSGFYPMLIICTLSCIGMMFKIDLKASFLATFCAMMVTFASYFVTLYIATYAMAVAIPKISSKEVSFNRDATFVMYSLGIMMLIDIIINIVPVSSVLFKFLPVYIAVIIYKADKFMGIKEAFTGHFVLLSILTIMLPPYLISYIFRLIDL